MSEILYNFNANNSSLDDVSGNIAATNEVRSDIDNVFNLLATVYTGDGATQLSLAHQKFSAAFEDALAGASKSTQFALDQQAAMQALDRANAASLE